MAVENKWADSDLEAGNRSNPARVAGGQVREFSAQLEIAAADDDGSIYKIARLPANAILTKLELHSDAIAGATSYSVGLYEEDGTTVIDLDEFMAATDINAGNAIGSPLNAMSAVAIENLAKKLYELAGHTVDTKKKGYVLAITATTAGSAAGTISLRGRYIQG